MSDRYGITGDQDISTGPSLAVLGLHADTLTREKIYEMAWGSVAAPSDVFVDWIVLRGDTGLGTSTAVTPAPLDEDAPVSQTTAGENYTANPTFTLTEALFRIGLNLRASWRWVAAPEGEIMIAATAVDSVVITPDAAAGGLVAATMHFLE